MTRESEKKAPLNAASEARREWLRAGFRRPQRVYLALALTFGLALLIVTPPFQVADEEAHFRRSFELSLGRIIAIKNGDYTGDYLPQGVDAPWQQQFRRLCAHPEEKTSRAEIVESANLRFSPSEREFVAFSNTAIHTPLTYLPQALAIFVARQFSSSVLVSLYAGRLLNLLAAVVLTFLAIRRTPVLKWAFVALALTPMAVFQAASVSSDALTNALAFLLVGQVLACAFGSEERLPFRSVAAIAGLGSAIGLAKQLYFLLPLAYLLIPVRKLDTRMRYWTGLALVLGATLVPLGAWSVVVRDIYSRPDFRYGADPGEQMRRLLSEPAQFLRTLQGTFYRVREYGEEYLGFLGWLDARLPTPIYLAELALLVTVCLADGNSRSQITGRQALLALAVASVVSASVLMIVHITWDVVRSPYIVAQGRYFIPVGPILAVALCYAGGWLRGVSRTVGRFLPATTALAIPVLLAVALFRVHDRYYVDSDAARADRAYLRGFALLREPDKMEEGYRLLEDAVRIENDHRGANYLLGVRLRNVRPREAAEHFRTVLRRDAAYLPALKQLGGLLAEQLEFPEAIACFKKGLTINPNDSELKQFLERASHEHRELSAVVERYNQAIQQLARSSMAEERYRGTAREGMYLKPSRSRIEPASGPRWDIDFCWRCPPPSGQDICLSAKNEPQHAPFFACSNALFGPKRLFVFPPPVNAKLLDDAEVSWFYQVPLADLTVAEQERETSYRALRQLHFPLATLPE